MVVSDLSSISGWVSIACWVVVYSPQIYENYSLQSGEGLSVLFVLIWLLGDFCNVLGAIFASLLPTIILLGVYYSLCDLILLGQIYYYRWKRNYSVPRREEHEPLLRTNEQPTEYTSAAVIMIRYICATCFVMAVGVVAWWLSRGSNQSISEPETPPMAPEWLIQSLGWTSAVSYLGARIPQIFKNFKTRCEGLSPALFFFAILGNTTYALSICAKSMDQDYLMLNASWLAGSILTVFLDILVIAQILYFRTVDNVRMSVFV